MCNEEHEAYETVYELNQLVYKQYSLLEETNPTQNSHWLDILPIFTITSGNNCYSIDLITHTTNGIIIEVELYNSETNYSRKFIDEEQDLLEPLIDLIKRNLELVKHTLNFISL